MEEVIPTPDIPTPEEILARRAKEKIARWKKKKGIVEPKNTKNTKRPVQGKKGEKRPCQRCGKTICPTETRVKYCAPCARQINSDTTKERAGTNPLVQIDVEDVLAPLLQMGCSVKEACLEAGLVYSTIMDKKKEWL